MTFAGLLQHERASHRTFKCTPSTTESFVPPRAGQRTLPTAPAGACLGQAPMPLRGAVRACGVSGSSVWMVGSEEMSDTNLVYTSSTLSTPCAG